MGVVLETMKSFAGFGADRYKMDCSGSLGDVEDDELMESL